MNRRKYPTGTWLDLLTTEENALKHQDVEAWLSIGSSNYFEYMLRQKGKQISK
jgi:hypothetical protein